MHTEVAAAPLPYPAQPHEASHPHVPFASGVSSQGMHWTIYCADAKEVLATLPDQSFHCAVTSPPYYWLRDYGVTGQIGQEDKVSQYVAAIADTMDQVRRTLRDNGSLFLNLGDTYYSGKGESQGVDRKNNKRRFGLRAVDRSGGLDVGVKPKCLIGIPWRVALEMMSRSWVLRSSIIWHRKYALPEAVKDRPRRSYEYVFMFVKKRSYYFNRSALEDVKLEEDVWTIRAKPKPTNGIDTAPFPDDLVQRCLDLGCPTGGSVLDPFAGGGTTLRVALAHQRHATGIDLNPAFCRYMASVLPRA